MSERDRVIKNVEETVEVLVRMYQKIKVDGNCYMSDVSEMCQDVSGCVRNVSGMCQDVSGCVRIT